ncbi:d-2-hydroxyglutarate mitochondrial precursor [Plasmopara halstedii]|uniref:D-2-hydroxyglutarate mitochondrial n=1 Tax=Plasmopara halstedii TaxID=4781 RepID=A0A0N7L8E3_PLAHL|nr:d-2-hydroxyglutarate mitochondrial precursor [Plasmopara halstedii]CEG49635.1 d-2-hydroxyglutarate mitochondrial precursor [Plasmopara halstedii]|eukprot:XP_024586004.1 d-2-hydroxyglutarate mitochondrial precursor [Plasmopara halstedii]
MLASVLRSARYRSGAKSSRHCFAIIHDYSTPARNPALACWNSDDKSYFQQLLKPENVLTDIEDTKPFTVDWLVKYKAQSNHQMVLKPKTTAQVSAILNYCNQRNLSVVPQGGNTGLVGGSVPVYDEIVLSMSSMNNVISFDEVSGVLVCEAGCILENLDSYVAKHGYMMPLDLGAKGTCQIGGNVATNAGGLRLLRYGSLHGTVLGIEAVLADGTVIDCLSTMRKDNTGYDLKQLFIGSEGTLGVVTKVSILTPPRSSSKNVALLACEDFAACQKAFVEAKKNLGEVLSAVEFMDRQSLDIVFSQQDWTKDPLETISPFYVLIETSGSNSHHDMEKLEAFLEDVMGSGVVVDGTVAQDASQAQKLFMLREDISLSLSSRGFVYKYDISLPLDQYYKIVEEVRDIVTPLGAEVVGFGHMGDCNLHLNVSTREYDEKVFNALEPFVFEWTSKYRGSISSEHGIGTHKPPFLHLSKSDDSIRLMRQVKQLMDPKGILNPYKVLPNEI